MMKTTTDDAPSLTIPCPAWCQEATTGHEWGIPTTTPGGFWRSHSQEFGPLTVAMDEVVTDGHRSLGRAEVVWHGPDYGGSLSRGDAELLVSLIPGVYAFADLING